MSFGCDESRYQRELKRMHIATERKQSWWGLCPIRTKPSFIDSEKDYEQEQRELREERYHWFLAWCLSQPPGEVTERNSPFPN